jgi:hypothetical protein
VELIQKSFLSHKHYTIEKDRIIVNTKNINTYEEYFIKLEEIGLDLNYSRTKGVFWLIPINLAALALGTYILFDEVRNGIKFPEILFWVFSFLLFATMAFFSFFQKSEKVFLVGGSTTLELNAINPNKEEVNTFIKQIHLSIKQHYKSKYGKIDVTLDEATQIHNYKWLKEINAISEEEFESFIESFNIKKLI